jgi:MFS family permease
VGANADRLGPKVVFVGGLAVLGIGFWLMTRITPSSDWDVLLPGLFVAGLGGAAIQAQLTNVAISSAPREQAGLASGISATMRQVGSSIGIALLGAIFTSRYGHYLPQELAAAQVPPDFASQLVHGIAGNVSFAGRVPPGVPTQFAPIIQKATHAAFIYSFNDAVRFAVLLIAVGILVSLVFIRRKDMQHTNGAPQAVEQAVRPPELVEVEQ